MSIFAENLKYLRKHNFVTQKSIAGMIGLSRSAVSALENNKNEPSTDTLIKLSEYFDVTIDELVKRDLGT